MGIRKFDQIDGLRFFAVFAVLCAHWRWAGTEFCQANSFGVRGVELFFVISGFLITLGLIRSKEKNQTKGKMLGNFYVRRFLRIVPIYYLTILFLLIFHYKEMAGSIWWYLLYLCNFHSIAINDWGFAGHFWSLSVEEQFYLVWPFIILLLPNKRLPIAIISCIVISVIFKSYWHIKQYPMWWTYMHPIASLDLLSFGGLLAYVYQFHQERLRNFLYSPWLIGIMIMLLIFFTSIKSFNQYDLLFNWGLRWSFALFCIWLVGRATFGFSGIIGAILENSVVRYIGKISYSIYIFHIFIPGILLGLTFPVDNNLRFLMNAVVTIGLSSISWYFFESKILKFKERFE